MSDRRVALVTAASKGIGYGVAKGLATAGMDLAICARDAEQLKTAASQLRQQTGVQVLAIPADVGKAEDVERFVAAAAEQFGSIHSVIFNPPPPPGGSFLELRDEQWELTLSTVFMSAVRLIRAAVPWLERAEAPRIVFLSSRTVKQPIPHLTTSTVVRAAVAGLAKCLANELAPRGILVNTVLLGAFWTARSESLLRSQAEREGKDVEELKASIGDIVPLGRYGLLEEIVPLVSFLASPESSYVTGSAINLDGGLTQYIL